MYHYMNTHPPRAGIVKPPCACFLLSSPPARQAPLLLYGVADPVRVCDRCFQDAPVRTNERTNGRTNERARLLERARQAERATAERETTAHAVPARWRPRPSRDTDTTNQRGSVSCIELTRNDPSIDRSIVVYAERSIDRSVDRDDVRRDRERVRDEAPPAARARRDAPQGKHRRALARGAARTADATVFHGRRDQTSVTARGHL